MNSILNAGNGIIGLMVFAALSAAQKPAAPASTSQQTASISGTVVSSAGTPLSAIVRVNSNASSTASVASLSLTTTSASNGSFQLSKVPPGTYQICVTVQSGPFVDPCLWTPGGTAVPLAASQSLAAQVIQVQQAAVLHVRINDPQQLSNTEQSNGTPRGILMGVFASGGLFYPLLPTSSDATGYDQEIAIPGGTTVPFTIAPIGLTMTDGSGNPVASTGATVSVSVPPASISTPMVLTYNVTAAQ
jgi:hypothetical protein